jgi:hypothetical protein
MAGIAVRKYLIWDAADIARGVQWDEKREGRTRSLAADYDYIHEQCAKGAVDRLSRHRLYRCEFIRDRESFRLATGDRAVIRLSGIVLPYAVDEAAIDEGAGR